jgi:hypothetical protein
VSPESRWNCDATPPRRPSLGGSPQRPYCIPHTVRSAAKTDRPTDRPLQMPAVVTSGPCLGRSSRDSRDSRHGPVRAWIFADLTQYMYVVDSLERAEKPSTNLKPGIPRATSQPASLKTPPPPPPLTTAHPTKLHLQSNRTEARRRKPSGRAGSGGNRGEARARTHRQAGSGELRSTTASLQVLQLNPKTGQKVNRCSTNPRQTKQRMGIDLT